MNHVGAVLVATGALLTLVAAIGVVRMPDVYARLHAATKATSLGVALLLGGVAFRRPDLDVIVKAAVIVLFQFATAPVAAHVLARRAHRSELEFDVHVDDLRADAERWPNRFDDDDGERSPA